MRLDIVGADGRGALSVAGEEIGWDLTYRPRTYLGAREAREPALAASRNS